MGTHPIFESDFDCLTEQKSVANQNGPKKRTRAKGRQFYHAAFYRISRMSRLSPIGFGAVRGRRRKRGSLVRNMLRPFRLLVQSESAAVISTMNPIFVAQHLFC